MDTLPVAKPKWDQHVFWCGGWDPPKMLHVSGGIPLSSPNKQYQVLVSVFLSTLWTPIGKSIPGTSVYVCVLHIKLFFLLVLRRIRNWFVLEAFLLFRHEAEEVLPWGANSKLLYRLVEVCSKGNCRLIGVKISVHRGNIYDRRDWRVAKAHYTIYLVMMWFSTRNSYT